MTTKVHLACDGKERPLAVLITPGWRHDGICARTLLERTRVPRAGIGRRRYRPDHVIADTVDSSPGFHGYLRQRGIARTIPRRKTSASTAATAAGETADRQALTAIPTAVATPSNAASTVSKPSAALLPDTTRRPPPTRQRSVSHRCCSGQDRFTLVPPLSYSPPHRAWRLITDRRSVNPAAAVRALGVHTLACT
ncbi:transposase [Streptomyces sp. NPDC094149]|uniref:transposase n=1 Tax=Streptomyces sp. NPDC094149 TaxID=3155079 RepID=UPI00332E22E1